MPEKIRMNYPQMEQMARTFEQEAQRLQDVNKQMKGIADSLEQGALVGQAGAAFSEAIRSKLLPALNKLQIKFTEERKDVLDAMSKMKAADKESKSKLGG